MKAMMFALLLTPMVSVAGPDRKGPPSPEKRAQAEKRMRMMMVVGLAEALELSEAEALRLAEQVRSFDQRRSPIRESILEASRTLKQAAEGEAAALSQVDQATQKILDARQQMAALDKEMFNALSKGLTPQRKAKLALFLARFHGEMKGHLRHGMGRGQSKGRPMGPKSGSPDTVW